MSSLLARLVPLLAALWLAALPGHAGSPLEKVPEGADIPVEQWAAMARGRTLTYRLMDGTLFAREYYIPGGNRLTLTFPDGTCLRGTWDYSPPRYCYHWEREGTVCFRHLRRGDGALVIQLAEDGSDTLSFQLMTEIADAPLACGQPLVG